MVHSQSIRMTDLENKEGLWVDSPIEACCSKLRVIYSFYCGLGFIFIAIDQPCVSWPVCIIMSLNLKKNLNVMIERIFSQTKKKHSNLKTEFLSYCIKERNSEPCPSLSPGGQQEVLSLAVYDRGPQICSPDTQSHCVGRVKFKNFSVVGKSPF